MSQIREKILEIEKNISDGEMMLRVLRQLPESEQADSLKAVPSDTAQSSFTGDSAPPVAPARRDSDADSDETEGLSLPAGQKDTSVDNKLTDQQGSQVAADDTHEEHPTVVIDPTDWPLHFQAQVCQLSHMFTQVDRFEDMLNRLLVLVKALNLTPQEELLNDVSQRFIELKSSLTSLKKAYDGLSAHDTASDAFRARQLVSLRGFLVDLGRNLEMTKECFFSVANIVKQAISDHGVPEDESEEGPSASNEGNDKASAVHPEASASCVGKTEPGEDKDDEGTSIAGDTAPAEPTQQIEVELMALCKQRDTLLHQLAEARAQTIGSISAAQEKLNGISGFLAAHGKASNLDATVPVNAPVVSLSANTLDEALPILRKLRARQNHLEEMREELRNLCVDTDNVCEQSEADRESSSTSSHQRNPTSSQKTAVRVVDSAAPVFGSGLKTMPARPKSAPKSSLPPRHKEGTKVETSSRTMGYSNIPSILPSVLNSISTRVGDVRPAGLASGDLSQGLLGVTSVDSCKTEETMADDLQATYTDNTEHLYRSARDNSHWHEQRCKQPHASKAIGLQIPGTATEIIAKQLANVSASESNSHDQTCMATWGGSPEDDDMNNTGVYTEFLDVEENIPTTNPQSTSSKPAPATHLTIDKTNTNALHGCPVRMSNGNLNDHTSSTPTARRKFDGDCCSEPIDIALPRLGHSPSPLSQESHYNKIRTSISGHETIKSNRPNTTTIAEKVGGRDYTEAIGSHLVSLERKVDHLTQTCQLLVSENLRLNSNLASVMMNQALSRPFFLPGVVGQEWSPAATPLSTCLIPPFNGSIETFRPCGSSAVQFAPPTSLIATSAASLPSMSPMPFVGFPSYMPLHGSVQNTEAVVANTEQRVPMAFTTSPVRQPLSSVETVQDEIQALSSQIMQQQLRVAQLQREMQAMQVHRSSDFSRTAYLQAPQPVTATVCGNRVISAHVVTCQAGYHQAPVLPHTTKPLLPPQAWASRIPASNFVSVTRDARQGQFIILLVYSAHYLSIY
ncbi:unnamed protein product [Schistocephalus solidus]|uniref:Pericentrin n=1 Tax=Schistocephalus solidus TaxID=70667 RepID=A0A183SK54_SCHSO|nr:unnamed protein product [Schistocephalus solidus]